jgi:hypothetical protein
MMGMRGHDLGVEERSGGVVAADVDDFVRPRASWTPPLRPSPSTRSSERGTDERLVVGQRDPFLELEQPLEALLHNLLRHLLVETRGHRAGARRVLKRVRLVEPSALHDVEGSAEVLLGLAGKPTIMSVVTAMPGTASRIRSSQDRYRADR